MKRASFSCLCALIPFQVAVDYRRPPAGSRLVGENQTYTVQPEDRNLQAIARRFDTAAMLILEANNTMAPFPAPGTAVTIPLRLILPDTPHEGIIVNLAELRLYYYPPDGRIVQVFPVGIGQQGLETPITTTYVSQKILNPTWTPTAGIRARYLKKGIVLPQVVPAGPNNPLGRFAMRLGIGHGEYLIHGTNAPDSVGLRVSSGCIRMNSKDIKTLFSQVTTSTRVAIINEPVKYTREPDGRQYIEVHRPLAQRSDQDTQIVPITLTSQLNDAMANGNDTAIDNALRRRAGYPVMIFGRAVTTGECSVCA